MRQYSKEFEAFLSESERLGLAWCRLNCDEWDDYVGEKPAGFDGLTRYTREPILPFAHRRKSKFDVIWPIKKFVN